MIGIVRAAGKHEHEHSRASDAAQYAFGPIRPRFDVTRRDPTRYSGCFQVLANRIGDFAVFAGMADENLAGHTMAKAVVPVSFVNGESVR